jgi:hypothetical protein
MNRADFFEAAGELSNWAAHLSYTTDLALREAEDHLCRKQAHGFDVTPFIRGELGIIRETIEDLMTAFDILCEAAGQEPRFELAFRVLDAPGLVQWEIRECLDGLPPAPPRPLPRLLLHNPVEGEEP